MRSPPAAVEYVLNPARPSDDPTCSGVTSATTAEQQRPLNSLRPGGITREPADTAAADPANVPESTAQGPATVNSNSAATPSAPPRPHSLVEENATVKPEADSDDIYDFAHSRLATSPTALARVAFGILDPAFSQLRMLSKGRLEVGKSQSLHVQEQLCQCYRVSFHAASFRDMGFWTNREQDQMPIDYFMENYQSYIVRPKRGVTDGGDF